MMVVVLAATCGVCVRPMKNSVTITVEATADQPADLAAESLGRNRAQRDPGTATKKLDKSFSQKDASMITLYVVANMAIPHP